LLEAAHVAVNLGLEFMNLIQRTFREDGKVARVLSKDVAAQCVKALVKLHDWDDSLLELNSARAHAALTG
jgi:hypothetical protein